MTFLGLPNTTDPSIVKQLVDTVFKLLEQKLMKEDLTPTFWHHRSDSVEYMITKSFPFIMSFEKYNDTREKNSGRLAFVFRISDQDAIR